MGRNAAAARPAAEDDNLQLVRHQRGLQYCAVHRITMLSRESCKGVIPFADAHLGIVSHGDGCRMVPLSSIGHLLTAASQRYIDQNPPLRPLTASTEFSRGNPEQQAILDRV
jgi:hypothetical protein